MRSEEAGDVARFRQGAMAEAKWLQSLKGSYVPAYYGGCPTHEVMSIPVFSKAPALAERDEGEEATGTRSHLSAFCTITPPQTSPWLAVEGGLTKWSWVAEVRLRVSLLVHDE